MAKRHRYQARPGSEPGDDADLGRQPGFARAGEDVDDGSDAVLEHAANADVITRWIDLDAKSV